MNLFIVPSDNVSSTNTPISCRHFLDFVSRMVSILNVFIFFSSFILLLLFNLYNDVPINTYFRLIALTFSMVDKIVRSECNYHLCLTLHELRKYPYFLHSTKCAYLYLLVLFLVLSYIYSHVKT